MTSRSNKGGKTTVAWPDIIICKDCGKKIWPTISGVFRHKCGEDDSYFKIYEKGV